MKKELMVYYEKKKGKKKKRKERRRGREIGVGLYVNVGWLEELIDGVG